MNIDITVNVAELLEKVQNNREFHRAEFEKAWAGYEQAMREWFDEQLGKAQNGKSFDRIPPHPVPEDHTADYDQLIGMLEMNVNTTMDLDWSMYRQFVEDEWGWTHVTNITNSYYAARV